jgi:cellobiose phosphorylase
VDVDWDAGQGIVQRTTADEVFQGTILEHLLIQHLTGFFNVGEHNNIRLEGADWNDGMDMAAQRGESVAFTAYYAGNLRELAVLLHELNRLGITEVELMQELLPLLDSLHDPVDYNAPAAKQARLREYFGSVSNKIGGKKVRLSLAEVARDLQIKSDWLAQHLRANEWIETSSGYRWYNGYYDNDGQRLEGDHPLGARMTLTGQVFALMADIATDDQAIEIRRAADSLLYDEKVGGYRLNTDFKEVLLNMGRCFGFAYGHKENGAMFSHMAVMYAYALYQRGFAHAGYRALDSLYRQCANFPASRMYPGIPEYFTPDGRGVYPYLTGSASWYLLTLVTQVFGLRGRLGDLVLDPKLVAAQFDEQGNASIHTRFAGREIQVSYHNPLRRDYGQYRIQSVQVNGSSLNRAATQEVIIPRSSIQEHVPGKEVLIQVELG